MKNLLLTVILLCFCLPFVKAADQKMILISTNETDLILQVAPNGRLYQTYLGNKLVNESEFENLSWNIQAGTDGSVSTRGWEVYPCSGAEDYFEPAFAIQHNDGNMTSIFKYVSSESKKLDNNVTETIISLKDDVYPVEAKLHYVTFAKENVIKAWTEIRHMEKKPVTITQYASNMLYFESPRYVLTEFSGDWAKEVQMSSQDLKFGKKIIDTKLGSRAAMHAYPFFEIGLGAPASENTGDVLMGTIGWTGNYRFTFEVDNAGNLRVISGINPYASAYELELMEEAKHLGVDMFLLDDGWFANKHPRQNDKAGLGDWEVTHDKLPNGIPHLVQVAKDAGVKFGIWIEPEMVNPKSELFEKHPDWAIHLPNRETYYYRNQLVLDLSNPKVQDYVFSVVDNIMIENPDLAFFKWDCNSPITNVYSPYLKEKQNQLYIDHVRGVYNVFKRVAEKYPHLPIMLCSGGGARCDYEALKYFTEFWCSDNTDPIERLYIQWGFSQFFPAKAMCAHVTSWNKNTSIKFRTDVAMMCKMGFDISLKEMNDDEMKYCQEAVANYKRLKGTILDGDLYRLVSPYDTNHSSVMYVDKAKSKSVLFAYDIHPRFGEKTFPVKLQGLDPNKKYKVQEINLMPGQKSTLVTDGGTFSGDFLMKIGMNVFSTAHAHSKVIELTEAH